MNHFELFGLPVNFELDSASLATTYRDLQRTLHPDNFANSSERERLLSVQKSSQINDAYSILKSPIQRAEYILAICHEECLCLQSLVFQLGFRRCLHIFDQV